MPEQIEIDGDAVVNSTEEDIHESSEVVFIPDEPDISLSHQTSTYGHHWVDIPHALHNHATYKPGHCVELLHHRGTHRRRDFLQICSISQNVMSGQILLSGLLIRRNCFLNGMLDKQLNEVHLRLKVPGECPDDLRSVFNHAMVQRDINQVVKTRQMLFTNKLAEKNGTRHGDFSFRDSYAIYSNSPAYLQRKERAFREKLLVCRWAFLVRFERIPGKDTQSPKQFELRRFREFELNCNDLVQMFFRNVKSVPDIDLFRTWRGKNPSLDDRHAFADGFAGGGGASEAAAAASFSIKYAFDEDEKVLSTYRANRQHSTEVFHSDAWNFYALAAGLTTDVLHLSPPCQFFSSCHTVRGRNDDKNSAALFSIHSLVEKGKPRVVTLEQTASIINRHTNWFNALVNQFTTLNFGLRWSSVNFKDYGLAQNRSRLIILASCPGTSPPPFAKPSHGNGRGLLPWRSISDVLSSIPQQLVNPNHVSQNSSFNMPSYDGRTRQAACITRDGGDPRKNYHPSGLRPFTTRELAALQGFRHDFVLPERLTLARHVIGNAVPPLAFAPFLVEVKGYLEEQDEWIIQEKTKTITID